ncbi:hypothetical protein BT93_H3153 [Corymbia citriodora subsp. variegata]|nr:hypothetical protein BT93_H3153 [Corymbia citriodora subsp. variegata]
MASGSSPPAPDALQDQSIREGNSRASESFDIKLIKKEIETRLIVATLVASVTFTAAITFPGGYNVSRDPNPGMPTMLHHRWFQVFIIFDSLASYCSILSVITLLQAHDKPHKAKECLELGGPALSLAVIFMTVAFWASLILAVSKLKWLMILTLCVGVSFVGLIYIVALNVEDMQSGN